MCFPISMNVLLLALRMDVSLINKRCLQFLNETSRLIGNSPSFMIVFSTINNQHSSAMSDFNTGYRYVLLHPDQLRMHLADKLLSPLHSGPRLRPCIVRLVSNDIVALSGRQRLQPDERSCCDAGAFCRVLPVNSTQSSCTIMLCFLLRFRLFCTTPKQIHVLLQVHLHPGAYAHT